MLLMLRQVGILNLEISASWLLAVLGRDAGRVGAHADLADIAAATQNQRLCAGDGIAQDGGPYKAAPRNHSCGALLFE